MDKNFRRAGDLDFLDKQIKKNDDLKLGEPVFKRAGDLEHTRIVNSTADLKLTSSYFKRAGDLEPVPNNFKPAGDLSGKSLKEEIKDYILSVTSGQRYNAVCELGTLCGGGMTIVTFDKLKEMVNEGYNIVSAKYINDTMIDVEFQQFRQDKQIERRK